MAGNTKLRGFDVKSDAVMLERWGKQKMVPISSASVAALRHACKNDLPIKPAMQPRSSDTYIEYDSMYGRVNIRMSPETAKEFADFLDGASFEHKFKECHYDLVDDVRRVLKEHADYTNTDEPGVTSEDTDGR